MFDIWIHKRGMTGTGYAAWSSLYGVLARMGASCVYPMDEDTNLNGLICHTVYGLVTSEAAVRLGDESLFKPSQAKNSFLSDPTDEN
ncbi:MAG: hypothetical protein APF76_03505 [Desulfitibacter sp. BRH_c19]|nr:MAG: hypothetical protein APF76_03505 [Desulfitibacter sp. BRH_c19]